MLHHSQTRRHDLDALRACAMLLGILLHAAGSFTTFGWGIIDVRQSECFNWLFYIIHGFRMQLFFLLSGFFTVMLYQKRGLKALLMHRCKRVLFPLLIFTPLLVTATTAILQYGRALQGSPIYSTPNSTVFSSLANFLEHYNLHHLWFLWFLCIYVTCFALFSPLKRWIKKIPSQWVATPLCLLWLLPLTFLPQSEMSRAYTFWGPESSLHLLPTVRVLAYYSIFYFFGGMLYRCDMSAITHRYRLFGGLAFFLILPLGITCEWDFHNLASNLLSHHDREHLSDLLQVAYTWCVIFWSMGIFKKCMSHPSAKFRYLSDASYWLYLTHLPVVFALQLYISNWQLPLFLKFSLVNLVTFGSLLLLYHFLVRGKWIGNLLNGKPSTQSTR